MKIFLNNIRLHARHGVMLQEQSVGAEFLVTIEAETNNEQSTLTDELSDTVSYAEMSEVVREEMSTPSKLLEHAAGRIVRRLLEEFPTLIRVSVRLTKLSPPIVGLQCDGAGTEITINKQ